MISLFHLTMRLRRLCVVLLLVASAAIVAMTTAQADKLDSRSHVASNSRPTKAAMLFHGNYCGVGSRAGTAPVDALDAACKRHDACAPSGGIPACGCNARLQVESSAIAQDPNQPAELQLLASATAAAAAVMICAQAPISAEGRVLRPAGARNGQGHDRHQAQR